MDNFNFYLVLADHKTEWISNQKLEKRFISAYKENLKNCKTINLSKLIKSPPDTKEKNLCFIFLSDQVDAPKVISEIRHNYKKEEVKYLIHLYGCFFTKYLSWLSLSNQLQDLDISLINLSKANAYAVRESLLLDEGISQVLSPPINHHNVTLDLKNRKQNMIKNKLNINQDVELFLYTGRISKEKNIDKMICTLSLYYQKLNKDFKLILVGHFDDYNTNHGISNLSHFGQYSYDFLRSIQNFQENLIFISHLEDQDLSNLYLGCNYFISMSTYFYEDYGLSVHEAIEYQLPCLLCNWGGYKEFAQGSNTFTVDINKNELSFDIKDFNYKLDCIRKKSQRANFLNDSFSDQLNFILNHKNNFKVKKNLKLAFSHFYNLYKNQDQLKGGILDKY